MPCDRQYLELLAEKYPSEAAACSELINLRSILTLPKGTEHFLSDIHGEYETFLHVLKNGSGSIRRRIDEVFGSSLLERERRNSIAAALMAKQHQQQQQVQQVSLRSEQESGRADSAKVPVPVASPVKQAARVRAANCARSSFSCDWPRLSESINDLKKLFGSTPSRGKKS